MAHSVAVWVASSRLSFAERWRVLSLLASLRAATANGDRARLVALADELRDAVA